VPYPTHVHGLLVRHRDVSHTTAFRTFKQLRKLFNVMSLDNGLANKPDIHAFTASSSSRCSAATQEPAVRYVNAGRTACPEPGRRSTDDHSADDTGRRE
jgi:hypothetical protein